MFPISKFIFIMLFFPLSAFAEEPFSLTETIYSIAHTDIAVFRTPKHEKSSGLFVYSHGMSSKTVYHTKLLQAMYDAGYDVIAYDLPGHGDSEKNLGINGSIKSFNQLVDVLSGVVTLGVENFGTQKVVVSGWSLGGLITTVYLQRNPDAAQAAILYAPGVSFAFMHGNLSILLGINPENLVHDKELAKTFKNDPSFFRFPPPSLLTAMLQGSCEANNKLYKTNTLLFSAGDDVFVHNKGILDFYRSAAEEHSTYLESHYFVNSKHDLENDIDSFDVLKETVGFINKLANSIKE